VQIFCSASIPHVIAARALIDGEERMRPADISDKI
jgi:hypothetical protein